MSLTTRGRPIVAKALAHRIIDLGIEVREVARRADLYDGTVTAILHGRPLVPTPETMAKLAKALDTTVEELFPGLMDDDGAVDSSDDGALDPWEAIAAEYASGFVPTTETARTE